MRKGDVLRLEDGRGICRTWHRGLMPRLGLVKIAAKGWLGWGGYSYSLTRRENISRT